jgi:AraC-type DNA-binding domain-containing proteins
MDLILSYVGLSQSLFGIILILTKKPLKIAQVILCVLILAFAMKFGLDILHIYKLLPENRWFISLGLTMLFAPLFYLYSKYITKEFEKFEKFDYLHGLPTLTLIVIFFTITNLPANQSLPIEVVLMKYIFIRNFFGYVFQILLVYYVISALIIVIKFKKQSIHYYSYNSYKISLNWLIMMILSFFVFVILIIIISLLYEKGKIGYNVHIFRHSVELTFVYVLSLWGFRQNQLNSVISTNSIENQEDETNDSLTGKYQKSGLKKEDAKNYIQNLKLYMEETEIWKDPELSISKLSSQTSIPKHQLSEVLNEYLGKSFYIFVNEYRVEYAKKLLSKKEYHNWSILAIAYECGFNSKTAFNIFFKKYTQLTPSEFKKFLEDQS